MRTPKINDAVSWKDDNGTDRYGMIVGFDETNFNGALLHCAIIDQGNPDNQLEIPLDDLEIIE